MNMQIRTQHGMSFVSVLAAMLILVVLYFGYFKLQSMSSERAVGKTAIDAGRAVACRTQRRAAEREIEIWVAQNPDQAPTLALLESDRIHIPSCPEDGAYSLEGKRLRCSIHGE